MMMPHDICVETHPGGGTIMGRKPPVLRNVGIEPDERVIGEFSCEHPVEHCREHLRGAGLSPGGPGLHRSAVSERRPDGIAAATTTRSRTTASCR